MPAVMGGLGSYPSLGGSGQVALPRAERLPAVPFSVAVHEDHLVAAEMTDAWIHRSPRWWKLRLSIVVLRLPAVD